MDDDRVSETDLVVSALRVAASQADGFIATADLIPALERVFNPTGRDAEIIPGRTDTYFSQKVRNLVSHKNTNFIANGYATHDSSRRGIVITQQGHDLLGALGR